MDFHSPMYEHFDPSALTSDPSDFHSEEYLEYRRRVFQELASEYGKQQSQHFHSDIISNIPGDYHELAELHYTLSPTEEYDFSGVPHTDYSRQNNDEIGDTPRELSPVEQIAWDDSDLQPEPVVTSPLLKRTPDKSTDGIRTNLLVLSDDESYGNEKSGMLDNGEDFTDGSIPSMHWTELEKQLELITKQHQDQERSKKENSPPHTPFSPRSKRRSTRSHLQKQKNDRQAILQKLTNEDNDSDIQYGSAKPWYNSRLERGNSQNLQICYINDSCSSSDNDETNSDSKTPLSMKSGARSSPASSPALPSPGFGMRRNMLYRMPSSSSTVSISSTSSAGHHASSTSLPTDGEIINISSSSTSADDIPKARTKQEQLEFQARIAITQAHQEAKRLAEEERRRSRKQSASSLKKLTPLDDVTRAKVKNRSLSNTDCSTMTVGQLQVILNNMHMEKEALNTDLKMILELRDELRTEQDAKLIDIDDLKSMLAVTGPETTV